MSPWERVKTSFRIEEGSCPLASGSSHQVYQSIGNSYSAARRPDPRIQRLIVSALGDAQSVVNVGAGTGNYEPTENERLVLRAGHAFQQATGWHTARPPVD